MNIICSLLYDIFIYIQFYHVFKVSQKYHSKSSVPLPPHVYGVAERAHQSLLMTNSSQCFVISGESGAGKTETCKYLVQHLVFIAGSEESKLNGKISQVCQHKNNS